MTLKIIDMTEACSAEEFTFAVWHHSWFMEQRVSGQNSGAYVWTRQEWEDTTFNDDFKQQVRDLLPKPFDYEKALAEMDEKLGPPHPEDCDCLSCRLAEAARDMGRVTWQSFLNLTTHDEREQLLFVTEMAMNKLDPETRQIVEDRLNPPDVTLKKRNQDDEAIP